MRIVEKPANNTGELPYRVKDKFSSLSTMKIISTSPKLIIGGVVYYNKTCCILPDTREGRLQHITENVKAPGISCPPQVRNKQG